MTRQQPLIPRFYCDWVNWLIQMGKMAASDLTISGLSMATGSSVIEMFDNKPHNLQTITAFPSISTQFIIQINTNIVGTSQDINFLSILGHNFLDADVKFSLWRAGPGWSNPTQVQLTEVINLGTNASQTWTADNNGWTLATFTTLDVNNDEYRLVIDAAASNYDADIKIGSIQLGKYIDPPTRPNIELPLDLEFRNKIDETDGGQAFSNMQFDSAPDWYLAPYEVGTGSTGTVIKRAGRYVQNWVWSMLPDSNLIPADFQTEANLLTGNTMWNILQYTRGSHFPCLIQLDNTSTNEWLWARIYDQSPALQTSPNVYTINWNIREEF